MSHKPEIIKAKLADAAAALHVHAGLDFSTTEGAFYAAHKLRSLRTEIGAIIKALEAVEISPQLPLK